MPFDTDIYKNRGGGAVDFVGGYKEGLSMRDLHRKDQEQQRLQSEAQDTRAAYKRNLSFNEDGSTNVNRKQLLSDLGHDNPMQSMAQSQAFQKQDIEAAAAKREKQAHEAELIGRVAGQIKDQSSYMQGLQVLAKSGVDTSGMPEQYDPNLVNGYRMRALSVQDQLANEFKKQELDLKKRELGVKEREAGSGGMPGKMTEAQSKSLGFGRRAMLADQMLERVQSDPSFDVSSLKTQARMHLPKWAGGIKDPREQALVTSKLSFIASVLRKESGAAVTPDEFETYNKIYFPQPGDGDQAQMDKRTMRQNFIDTEKMTAGNAWRDPIPLKTSQQKVASQAAKPKTFKTNEIDWAE
jgi:hypothetical protein